MCEGDVKGTKRGGNGGTKKNFKLTKDEQLLEINVRSGNFNFKFLIQKRSLC